MDFRSQVILITGGSNGIGLATARLFAREGAHVGLVARTPERLADALHEIQTACSSPGQRYDVLPDDVADSNQAAFALAEVTRLAGLPDIVLRLRLRPPLRTSRRRSSTKPTSGESS